MSRIVSQGRFHNPVFMFIIFFFFVGLLCLNIFCNYQVVGRLMQLFTLSVLFAGRMCHPRPERLRMTCFYRMSQTGKRLHFHSARHVFNVYRVIIFPSKQIVSNSSGIESTVCLCMLLPINLTMGACSISCSSLTLGK